MTEITTSRRGRPRVHPTLEGESAEERKRRLDREQLSARRAAMTPEERAAKRRPYDEAYRARHGGRR